MYILAYIGHRVNFLFWLADAVIRGIFLSEWLSLTQMRIFVYRSCTGIGLYISSDLRVASVMVPHHSREKYLQIEKI